MDKRYKQKQVVYMSAEDWDRLEELQERYPGASISEIYRRGLKLLLAKGKGEVK
jgi:PHD/YefM family antitoxin component YafN of YafNO toxin-antitoxin module